jgi:hypothetical protein
MSVFLFLPPLLEEHAILIWSTMMSKHPLYSTFLLINIIYLFWTPWPRGEAWHHLDCSDSGSLTGLATTSARCQECLPPWHPDKDGVLLSVGRLYGPDSLRHGLQAQLVPLQPQAGSSSLIQSLRHLLALIGLRREASSRLRRTPLCSSSAAA